MNAQTVCKGCQHVNQGSVAFCQKCGLPVERNTMALEGQEVGKYKLVEKIGGGGFGEVYRAKHVELGNPFAVKILHPSLAVDGQFVERFRHEAMVLAGLQHENVVQVVDFGQKEDLGFYLAMEWLEGVTLHKQWRRKRVLPLGQIYAIFSQLLDALQMAHDRGVVHRDMKPENLILSTGSRGRTILKIVDFGIAKIIHGNAAQDPLNQSGMAIGTPYYMSPEQAAGQMQMVDHRTDLYACGVILTELLTGRRIFRTKDPKKILRMQIESPVPQLSALSPNRSYPASLQHIIEKALAKNPNHRYNSASEFYNELDAAMKAEGIQPQEEDFDTTATANLAAFGIRGDTNEIESPITTGSHFKGQKDSGIQSGISASISGATPAGKSGPGLLVWGGVAALVAILALVGLQFTKPSAPKGTNAGKGQKNLTLPKFKKKQPELPKEDKKDKPKEEKPEARKPKVEKPKKAVKSKRRRYKRRRRRRRYRRRKRPVRRAPVKRRVEKRPAPVAKALMLYKVSSTPSGAAVHVNGSKKGKTPVLLRIPQGKRVTIKISKKGYVTETFKWSAFKSGRKHVKLVDEIF